MLHPRDVDQPHLSHSSETQRNCVDSVPSELLCPVTCSPFPSMTIPMCTCNDGSCPSFEPRNVEARDEPPRHSQASTTDQDKIEGPRLDKTTCSNMLWGRRSYSRENQCNSEINAWIGLCLYRYWLHFSIYRAVFLQFFLQASLKWWNSVDISERRKNSYAEFSGISATLSPSACHLKTSCVKLV